MSRFGAGLAAAGFLVSVGSAFFLAISFLMIGLTPLPLLTGGAGIAMVAVGLFVAGWFASPEDQVRGFQPCRVCARSVRTGAIHCPSCDTYLAGTDGRIGCSACGTDNETDAVYCKFCASAL